MAYAATDPAEIRGVESAGPARNLVAPAILAGFSRRSDLRGAMQFGAHGACIATTGMLVWLAEPLWYLLVPAMLLHGVTIVTLLRRCMIASTAPPSRTGAPMRSSAGSPAC